MENGKNEVEVVKCGADELQMLVDKSALTVEGLVEPAFRQLLDWVEQRAGLKRRRVYVTMGSVANEAWRLTGDNRYPDGLHIVSVLLDDMEDSEKIVLPRFKIGGRYMDDVRNNNLWREKMKEKAI